MTYFMGHYIRILNSRKRWEVVKRTFAGDSFECVENGSSIKYQGWLVPTE